MQKILIDVVTDIVCPWCFIGMARLDRALAAAGLDAEIVHHPFFLDPNVPPEGIEVAAMLRRKYGGDPSAMFARVESEAARSGIALDLSKQPRQRPTAAAHTLVRLANDRGTAHRLAWALFEAHFVQAHNIANPDVLAEIASIHGFGADEARAIATDAAELGLTGEAAASSAASGIGGVPFFVLDRKQALSGCQPEDVFAQALASAMTAEAG